MMMTVAKKQFAEDVLCLCKFIIFLLKSLANFSPVAGISLNGRSAIRSLEQWFSTAGPH